VPWWEAAALELLIAAVLFILRDPLHVVVFLACGVIARYAWVAVVAGVVYGLAIFFLFVAPGVERNAEIYALACVIASVVGMTVAYGLKMLVLHFLRR